ncbi:MAG: DUF4272 domain-containing protein [Cyclobacteriaceae bacterium]
MDHGTFYTHQLMYDNLIDLTRKHMPNGKFDFKEENEFKTIEIVQKGGLFGKSKQLKISYRERENPSFHLNQVQCPLENNLYGMIEFVSQINANDTTIRDLFLQKIATVNAEFSISCEKGYTAEAISLLKEIGKVCSPFIFAQPSDFYNQSKMQHFLDEELRLLLDTRGNSEVKDLEINVDASYYDKEITVSDAAIERKQRSEAILRSHRVKINEYLPVVEEQVEIRSKKEVIDRIYALVTIAAKGEGVATEHLQDVMERLSIDSFSEKEEIWLATDTLTDQDKVNATWRYESLYLLLWSISRVEELPYPSVICPVEEIVAMIIKSSREDFAKQAKLRETSEILDMLDLIYRMNWACVDARLNGEEVSGNLQPGVVYERHYALNWLVNYMDQEWDNISTDT